MKYLFFSSRKSLSTVKAPSPSEPEDDFQILEDDKPLWFSIPCKAATRTRKSRTSSSDKDSLRANGIKDGPLETVNKEQQSDQAISKLRNQTVHQKIKKIKGNREEKVVAVPGNDPEELFCPEDPPAGDLMELKTNKRKQLKKVPKGTDNTEEQSQGTACSETGKPTMKMEKTDRKSSDLRRTKSSKDGNKNAKTNKILKGARNATQRSGKLKEKVYVDAAMGQSQEHPDAEDPHLCSGNLLVKISCMLTFKAFAS